MTKIGAATHVLRGIGAPINQHTVGAMVGWFNAEGGNWANGASYNPLNTTLNMPNARAINGVGVKAYNNWNEGINATVQTLRQPNMSGIRQAFMSSDPQAVIHAIGSSPWGTNGSLVAQTIGQATGRQYALPTSRNIAAAMAQPRQTGTGVTNIAPTSTTDMQGALTQSLLNESATPVSSTGKLKVVDPLSEAISLVNSGQFTTTSPAVTKLRNTGALGVAMAGKATQDAAAAGAGGDAQKLLGMIHQVAGAAYNQGNHSAALESAKQVRAQGTDCSGFVSWLMGPSGLGIWNTSYATPAIATAPGLQPGRGQQITVWNNKQPGNAGHVFIQIGNAYFASEGGVGVRQISTQEALNYIRNGSDGGAYQALHPKGL